MGQITAGLIGCGRIGYQFDLDEKRRGVWTHAGAYAKNDEIDFIGVYDKDDIVNEAANQYDIKVFQNIREMTPECDIISVAVPEKSHETVLNELLEGLKCFESTTKIIWMEKPFTGNYQIARNFVDKFAAHNCHIHVNYQRRFCHGFNILKQRGTPKHVDVTYVRGLYNTASHFVDLIVGLYGEPHEITTIKAGSDFVMHFRSEIWDDFRVNFSMLGGLRYNMCDAVFYYPTEVIKAPPLQTYLEITPSVVSEQYSEYYDLGETDKHELPYEPMLMQASVLVECIRSGNYSKLNNGLIVLKILEQVADDSRKISL